MIAENNDHFRHQEVRGGINLFSERGTGFRRNGLKRSVRNVPCKT
jgi:hypothetical protein